MNMNTAQSHSRIAISYADQSASVELSW